MSARTPDRYNDFGKTSYMNQNYIPEAFCFGSVGQYITVVRQTVESLLAGAISYKEPKIDDALLTVQNA